MVYLVQQYFSESAQRFPDKAAVRCGDEHASFSEVEAFSNAFARELRQNGIARGDFVPFFMGKGIHSVLSILSILKADCAYVPLDIDTPGPRLASILRSTSARHMVVDDVGETVIRRLLHASELPNLINVNQYHVEDPSPLEYENLSIDVAYVLFTSGSTGAPKGVMIPHKAIVDYIDWCVTTYDLSDDDVVANHAPLYFDNSTFDLYTAFKTGATLDLVPAELNLVLPKLISWMRDREVTVFFCVPSVMTLLLKSRRLKQDSFPRLRHLIFAGEVMQPAVLEEWIRRYPHVQFTNMYGPTEITVDCTYHVVNAQSWCRDEPVPIGRARANMELFVLGDDGHLSQAPGAHGELLVRGTSVAYGYLNDEARTEAVFVQNPIHSIYHDPLYRTGDMVAINDNGDYLFLGRVDAQIKFLGHRIELGEIEVALLKVSGIQEAVVVFNNTPDEQEIGALISCTDPDSSRQRILAELASHVPDYMAPTRLHFASGDFPRTPNGKYDRIQVHATVFNE